MRFALSEEQQWLKTTARRFCRENRSLATLEPGQTYPNPADLWRQMAQELGWPGLIIPETYGGAGLGFVELAALVEEMGRYLISSPFFSTVCLGTNALLRAGNQDQREKYLSKIAGGELTATLAYVEADDNTDPSAIQMVAKRNADSYHLSGTKTFVIDGHTADLMIVTARSDDTDKIELFALPGDTSGLKRRALPNMDQTRCLSELVFDAVQVPATAKLDSGNENTLIDILNSAAVALAAEQVGGAERCLEMAVDYAKERHQFGQAIGSFQAIKHKCADMLLKVESARSAAYYAAWATSHAPEELSFIAPLTKVYCSEAYFECASENIQIHGGIGFTWEHEAHRYFKRAQADELFLGTPSQHRESLARELDL